MRKLMTIAMLLAAACLVSSVQAQNPLVRNMYSADPSARVFGDSVYVYPSHDILASTGKGRPGWFCMEDYHVFSSADLVDWKDNGIVVTQNRIPWVKPDSYSMWAPDCIEKNGRYYFYFPTTPGDTVTYGRGFAVGVAIAANPWGPYIPKTEPIKNVKGIDPNVFIDKDGQAYLFWALGNIYGAKLKADMLELASEPRILGELPAKGLKEGPYLFERNGIYYLTYPHVENKTERLEYAIGDNPLGPFRFGGVIMDESPNCWTNHQSIISFKGQWYLFYHYNDLSPNFDKARSIRADSLFFNSDGTIRKVIPTLRGVGVSIATHNIQTDRFSSKSESGVSIDFLDTSNRFAGWKTVFTSPGSWIQYNTVDFGRKKLNAVTARCISSSGSSLQIHLDSVNGPLLGRIAIPKTQEWKELSVKISGWSPGIHHLVVVQDAGQATELDWVRFE